MRVEKFELEGVKITRKVLKRGKPKISLNPAADLEETNLKNWVGKYGVFASFVKTGTINDMALNLASIGTDDLKTIINLCSGLDIKTGAYNRLTAELMNRNLKTKNPTI